MSNYVSNCPNCGAPLRGYGRCDYCGTSINQPTQFITVRPGLRKLVCQTQVPLQLCKEHAEAATDYIKNDIKGKMAEALTDSIKFISQRQIDPRHWEEVIIVRGELWVSDPDIRY